ncbi:hypothetical protein B0T22DRAFT_515331 [Podospora appendiculata]|uniref:Uncharacterized protein n=1 Tax=Podospora appendiculata TaxID=314037 RepID=A0AAE0XCQ5_9PEZI|nr:hypothetical protein B0T22DRAFT_515331 [Podospora appendiculata]
MNPTSPTKRDSTGRGQGHDNLDQSSYDGQGASSNAFSAPNASDSAIASTNPIDDPFASSRNNSFPTTMEDIFGSSHTMNNPAFTIDPRLKGKSVQLPPRLSATKMQSIKLGYNSGLCGNRHCRKPDPELSHCRGPPSTRGDILGCVLCNTDEHVRDSCPRVKFLTPNDLYTKLVLHHKDLPPIRSSINILLMATRLNVLVRLNNYTFTLTKERVISHWIPKKLWKLPATSTSLDRANDWDKYTRSFTFIPDKIGPENIFLENTWSKGLGDAYQKRQEMAFFQIPQLVREDERRKMKQAMKDKDEELAELRAELEERMTLVKNLSDLLARKEEIGNEAREGLGHTWWVSGIVW